MNNLPTIYTINGFTRNRTKPEKMAMKGKHFRPPVNLATTEKRRCGQSLFTQNGIGIFCIQECYSLKYRWVLSVVLLGTFNQSFTIHRFLSFPLLSFMLIKSFLCGVFYVVFVCSGTTATPPPYSTPPPSTFNRKLPHQYLFFFRLPCYRIYEFCIWL